MPHVMRRLIHKGVDDLAVLGTSPDWKAILRHGADIVLSPTSSWVRARSSVRPMQLQVIAGGEL